MAEAKPILLVPCPQCGRDRKVPHHRRFERSSPETLCRRCSARRNVCHAWHGGKPTRLYHIWIGMRRRCGLLKGDSQKEKYWHGRGITITPEWAESFPPFRDWALENGYRDDLTIDRIENDGPYAPSNCRWATVQEQNRNTRSNRLITLDGRTQPLIAWAEERGLSYGAVFQRLKKGWPVERALTEPIGSRWKRKPHAEHADLAVGR